MNDKKTNINVFIAYARKDVHYLDQLRIYLKPLDRNKTIKIWYDGEIVPGTVWDKHIKTNLHNADIILMLVSAYSLASDYFYDKELVDAMERHNREETIVIPVILSECLWEHTDLKHLQALPKNGKPLKSWDDESSAYTNIVRGLYKSLELVKKRRENRAKAIKLAEDRKEEEAIANRKAEEEQRLKEEVEANSREEESKLKDKSDKGITKEELVDGSEKNIGDSSEKKSNKKIILIIAGIFIVFLIVIMKVTFRENMITKFSGHSSSIRSVAFSPDGMTVLTGSADNTARLWDLKGNLIQKFTGHSSWIQSVAFSPDGMTVLTSSADNTARLWYVK